MKDMGKGNVAYERKVTKHFLQRIPDDLDNLYRSLRTENYEQIKETAHSLRTTLAIMGVLQRAVQILDALEFPQNDKSNFKHLISSLEMISKGAVTEAEYYLNSLEEK